MKDRIKSPVMMIAIGMVLILMTCLIPLIKSSRWDNLLLTDALAIGTLVVIGFFVTSIALAKGQKM